MDDRHDALVSLFTHRMIVTDLKLGALMEISEELMSTVTIECGGAQDIESHIIATEGMARYITIEDILSRQHGDMTLEFFHNSYTPRTTGRPGYCLRRSLPIGTGSNISTKRRKL